MSKEDKRYKILYKQALNESVTKMVIDAPNVSAKAQPGQFVILRVSKNGERIPLTIADYDRKLGTITIIFQIIGHTTGKLNLLDVGDYLEDFAGPLGEASHTEGFKKVCVVGGGVGCAIAYPVAKKFKKNGAEIHSIIGFRSKELVILDRDFAAVSDRFLLMTDDGSAGEKGLVTNALQSLIDSGEEYDEVVVIGPLIMMKFVCALTKKYNIKTVVSMNPIMIDGTGMCGCCRLSVNGKIRFACVDGPEFDGHEVDFDQLIKRNMTYHDFEARQRDKDCNLMKGGSTDA